MESYKRVFCVFLLFVSVIFAEGSGCPTLSVSPCTCTDSPFPFLACDQVVEIDVLKSVFLNSAGTKYNSVRLTNAVLQYLPHDLFQGVEVQELHLINGTFVQIFDETPENVASLRTLHIENTNIFRGIDWRHLEPMANLRILNVYFSKIGALRNEFYQYAPKSLEQISLYDTATSKVQPGVFGNFPNLDKVAIDHGRLRDLKRNIFPVPFNGRFLYFNENQLTSIPADMFHDMPNLQTVSLRGNSLTAISPFPTENLQYLNLEGNPLNCDCDLAWIVQKKNLVLKGACASPPVLEGKDLREAYKTMICS